MSKLYRWGRIATMAVAIATLATGVFAYAASPTQSITLSPYSQRYTLDTGQTVSGTLTVLNDGQTAYDFTVYATPYWVNNSAYQPNFTTNRAQADAYQWITFPKVKYHIEAHQTITVPYTIHVPKNAAPGGHYGTIFTEMQPNGSATDQSLLRKRRVGCILYITVNGDVHLVGQTTHLTIPWFQSSTPMIASAKFTNTGNTDYVATTKFVIRDIFGHEKGSATNQYEVLPGTTRDATPSWASASRIGLYHVDVTSNVLDKTTTASSYVLMMPLWVVLLVILIILVGGGFGLGHRLRKHAKTD